VIFCALYKVRAETQITKYNKSKKFLTNEMKYFVHFIKRAGRARKYRKCFLKVQVIIFLSYRLSVTHRNTTSFDNLRTARKRANILVRAETPHNNISFVLPEKSVLLDLWGFWTPRLNQMVIFTMNNIEMKQNCCFHSSKIIY
jgi:hypothetical protein